MKFELHGIMEYFLLWLTIDILSFSILGRLVEEGAIPLLAISTLTALLCYLSDVYRYGVGIRRDTAQKVQYIGICAPIAIICDALLFKTYGV